LTSGYRRHTVGCRVVVNGRSTVRAPLSMSLDRPGFIAANLGDGTYR